MMLKKMMTTAATAAATATTTASKLKAPTGGVNPTLIPFTMQRIDHIVLRSHHAQRMIDFYVGVLGMTIPFEVLWWCIVPSFLCPSP